MAHTWDNTSFTLSTSRLGPLLSIQCGDKPGTLKLFYHAHFGHETFRFDLFRDDVELWWKYINESRTGPIAYDENGRFVFYDFRERYLFVPLADLHTLICFYISTGAVRDLETWLSDILYRGKHA